MIILWSSRRENEYNLNVGITHQTRISSFAVSPGEFLSAHCFLPGSVVIVMVFVLFL